MQPTRGIGFQDLDRFRNPDVWRERNRQVRMVRNTSGSSDWDSVIAADSREVFPELRQTLFGNKISTLFAAEDAMDQNVGILVGHAPTIQSFVNMCLCRMSH
jgi:hypothetical protein